MDVSAIRRANLEILVSRFGDAWGSKQRAATALNLDPSHMSQMRSGKKMGDDVARKIEEAAALPHGWMDRSQDSAPVGVREDAAASYGPQSQLPRIDPEILASAYQLVRLAHKAMGQDFDPELPADARNVLLGYEYLDARAQRNVTTDNLVDFVSRLRERQAANSHQGQESNDKQQGKGSARSIGTSTG